MWLARLEHSLIHHHILRHSHVHTIHHIRHHHVIWHHLVHHVLFSLISNKTYHVWIAHSRITHSRPYLVHHRVHHGLLVHLRKLSLHHNSVDIWCHSCLQAFVKLGNICLKLLKSCILESYRSLRIFFLDSF